MVPIAITEPAARNQTYFRQAIKRHCAQTESTRSDLINRIICQIQILSRFEWSIETGGMVHITSLGKSDRVQRSLFTIRSKNVPKQNNLIMLRGGKVRVVNFVA